jgi:hypothetical protein
MWPGTGCDERHSFQITQYLSCGAAISANIPQMRELRWPGSRLPGWWGSGRTSKKPVLLRLPLVLAAALTAAFVVLIVSEPWTPATAGRYLPEVENPYCSIKTYKLRGVAEQASSMTDRLGRPVIVVNAMTLRDQPSYGRFLLAHECCHHTLGHVASAKKGLGHVGPQAFYYIAPELKRMELEADCCAVRLLRERNEDDGIDAGSVAMSVFGDQPTGAYYPTGLERVDNIRRCAAAVGQ